MLAAFALAAIVTACFFDLGNYFVKGSVDSQAEDPNSSRIEPKATGIPTLLIAGGSGSLGVPLCLHFAQLWSPRIRIVVIDKKPFHLSRQEQKDPAFSIDYHYGDIRNQSLLASVFDYIAHGNGELVAVVHLATVAHPSWCLDNLVDCRDINIVGTKTLLHELNHYTQAAAIASSRFIVFTPATRSTGDFVSIDEQAYYDIIADMERLVLLSNTESVRTAVLRIPTVYGMMNDHSERLLPSILHSFVTRDVLLLPYSSQRGSHSWLWITDLCAVVSMWLNQPAENLRSTTGLFHLSTNESWTIASTMFIVGKVLNTPYPPIVLQEEPSSRSMQDATIEVKANQGPFTQSVDLLPLLDKSQTFHLKAFASGVAVMVRKWNRIDLLHLRQRFDDTCADEIKYKLQDWDQCEIALYSTGSDFGLFQMSQKKKMLKKKYPDAGSRYQLQPLVLAYSHSVTPSDLFFGQHHEARVRYLSAVFFITEVSHSTVSIPSSNFTRPQLGLTFHPSNGTTTFTSTPSPLTIVYNPLTHTFAILFEYADSRTTATSSKVIGQLLYDAMVSPVASLDEVDFNFDISPLRCPKPGQGLPFLKRSENIYQMRGYRAREEPSLLPKIGLECSRIYFSMKFLKEDRSRLKQHIVESSVANSRTGTYSTPISLAAILAKGHRLIHHPDLTRLLRQPICDYDCSLHRVCLQTGHCRCVVPDICQRQSKYTFTAYRGFMIKTYPEPNWIFNGSLKLSQLLSNTSLKHTLTPLGREALHRKEEIGRRNIEGPKIFSDISTENKKFIKALPDCNQRCYMAGVYTTFLMYHLQRELNGSDLVNADYVFTWQHHGFLGTVGPKRRNSTTNADRLDSLEHLADKRSSAMYLLHYPHDMGGCLFHFSEHDLGYDVIDNQQVGNTTKRSILLQSMGAYGTNCYSPLKDIVAAAATQKAVVLRRYFSNVDLILPTTARPYLVYFSGSKTGTGYISRHRMTQSTLYPLSKAAAGNGSSSSGVKLALLNNYAPYPPAHTVKAYYNFTSDQFNTSHISRDDVYVYTLSQSKFCLVLRGVTGWTFRLSDVIYAGCIPVIIIDLLHNYYHDIIDYGQFSVIMEERDVSDIESRLLSIPNATLNRMQVMLLKVREAFLYDYKNIQINLVERADAFAFNYMSILLKDRITIFD